MWLETRVWKRGFLLFCEPVHVILVNHHSKIVILILTNLFYNIHVVTLYRIWLHVVPIPLKVKCVLNFNEFSVDRYICNVYPKVPREFSSLTYI